MPQRAPTARAGIGHLQQALGNRGMSRLLHTGAIQAKLSVGPADDEYEREADRVADEVMRLPEPRLDSAVQRSTLRNARFQPQLEQASQRSARPIQPACRACEALQRKSSPTTPGGPEQIRRKCPACEDEARQEEADGAAEVVAGVPDRDDTPVAGQLPPSLQRMCSNCEEELHRKTEGASEAGLDGALEAQIDNLSGGGEPLSESARAYFEPRFGQDFSDVRVHTSASAAATATSINALAYTRGRDVVFAPGQYQPATSSGRRLLAHELTHVTQQRTGGVGVTRKPAEDVLQRACGPAAIGTPAGCTPDASEPIGDLVLFQVNCDEFASGAERAKVVDFADSMEAGDRVRVHGFASTDGDPTFNHNLSCARALQAVGVLAANGISAGQIQVLEHGPTTGPAAQRRSVVLERTPGVSRPTVPQLSAVVTAGPTPGVCGDPPPNQLMNFLITWVLSRNSNATNGGFVIQEVNETWNVVDCTGAPVPNPDPRTSPLHFFEAWRATPGTAALTPAATDQFSWPAQAPWDGGCTDGTVTISATAHFHDNVATLPAHMITPNPATFAGGLQSSTTDPALGGNVSRPVRHELTFHWTCCPCSSSVAVVDSHTP